MSYRTPYPRSGRPLRRHPTDGEQLLWRRLRGGQIGGTRLRRQEPIGPYVVDFCALAVKLIVEVDGGQHAAHSEADSERTAFVERLGYRVLRFWNHEVLQNTEAVVERIAERLRDSRASDGGDG